MALEESRARLMPIHLDASLETTTDEDTDGRWSYTRGFFRR
ncbi:hypothetical protein N801_04195 [Knoellia aerolata DSM 18566]|uniref:Uncharacterized protein n=1 Tax=Knoellia aerolata DSM 18566 TaxID=1385519 RepID=A0A0A0K284_9MICO|nr:hypothetical protein N801_04195 [Knoellia aerolata DSM 18566]